MNREEMTIDEAKAIIRKEYLCVDRDCDIERNCGKCDLMMPSKEPILEAYKIAIKALEQQPKTGWIPVSERMPENRKEVLVTDDTDIFTGWYEGDKWCSCYEEFWLYSDPIIAWMPLPKPYEPQERSDKE